MEKATTSRQLAVEQPIVFIKLREDLTLQTNNIPDTIDKELISSQILVVHSRDVLTGASDEIKLQMDFDVLTAIFNSTLTGPGLAIVQSMNK